MNGSSDWITDKDIGGPYGYNLMVVQRDGVRFSCDSPIVPTDSKSMYRALTEAQERLIRAQPKTLREGFEASAAPRVSVVIPVYRHVHALARCLAALKHQSYPRDRFEVIVVDNEARLGPSRYRRLVRRLPQARLLREKAVGSYAARNKGIRHATGKIIAFTDADCLPAHDWIERGAAALLARPQCGLLGGRITLTVAEAGAPTEAEIFDRYFLGFDQKRFVERGAYAATANVFAYRDVFDRVGFFDARLRSGGDTEWGQRVRASGLPVEYADDVVVSHPARHTGADIVVKVRRNAGAYFQRNPHRDWQTTIKLARADLRNAKEMLERMRTEGHLTPRMSLLIRRAQLARATERVRLFLGGRPRRI